MGLGGWLGEGVSFAVGGAIHVVINATRILFAMYEPLYIKPLSAHHLCSVFKTVCGMRFLCVGVMCVRACVHKFDL